MGGNALKTVETRRCSREEFDTTSAELLNILKGVFIQVGIPAFYKNKKDFGDIDIVVSIEGWNGNMSTYILETFSPKEIFHNGNCYSFDYKDLQIDIIVSKSNTYDTLLHYLNYNDLGNLIGRLAHGLGLKYGEKGLFYEHQFKGKNIGEVIVSKNQSKIYEFLGLDYKRYEEGFNELEDIFEFIATSKYFNWKMYQLDQLNKINRDRNKKRKSYVSFLEWIDKNVDKNGDTFEDDTIFKFVKDKTIYFDDINKFFPEADLETEIRRLEYEECKKLYIQSKFNGGQVMLRYGLEGKQLGDTLKAFKGMFDSTEDFEEYIINTDKESIYDDFKHAYVTNE